MDAIGGMMKWVVWQVLEQICLPTQDHVIHER